MLQWPSSTSSIAVGSEVPSNYTSNYVQGYSNIPYLRCRNVCSISFKEALSFECKVLTIFMRYHTSNYNYSDKFPLTEFLLLIVQYLDLPRKNTVYILPETSVPIMEVALMEDISLSLLQGIQIQQKRVTVFITYQVTCFHVKSKTHWCQRSFQCQGVCLQEMLL